MAIMAREGDRGGQAPPLPPAGRRCQNDQTFAVSRMDLCKEVRQQGPDRQTYRHAQQNGHRDVDKLILEALSPASCPQR